MNVRNRSRCAMLTLVFSCFLHGVCPCQGGCSDSDVCLRIKAGDHGDEYVCGTAVALTIRLMPSDPRAELETVEQWLERAGLLSFPWEKEIRFQMRRCRGKATQGDLFDVAVVRAPWADNRTERLWGVGLFWEVPPEETACLDEGVYVLRASVAMPNGTGDRRYLHSNAVQLHLGKPRCAAEAAACHSDKGERHYWQKDYSAAIKEYKAALDLDPAGHGWHMVLGEIYEQIGDIENAVREFGMYVDAMRKQYSTGTDIDGPADALREIEARLNRLKEELSTMRKNVSVHKAKAVHADGEIEEEETGALRSRLGYILIITALGTVTVALVVARLYWSKRRRQSRDGH